MNKYDPSKIEPKWQKVWEEKNLYETKEDSRPKYYCLDFFPYPSGASLSVGHCRNYVPTDVISRYKKMKGFNVLHPMGWDAFGLPAENDAIKKKSHPLQSIPKNIANFKRQLQLIGTSYDWKREINSTDPGYYKWTQWFFLLLYKKGLAYQAVAEQWWCPSCKTVLANEQVEEGKCWRCGSEVAKKGLKQWFFKITDYADRLIKDLDEIDWPERIKLMQKNWIGRSEGIDIEYQIKGIKKKVTCFTTRPDTNFGATFIVLAPEHALALKITKKENLAEVKKYIEKAKKKNEIDRIAEGRKKTGVFTGAYAINNLNNQKMPIWISDFVLAHAGTGAVVGVPGHDLRDFEFAKEYDLPVVRVVKKQNVKILKSYLMGADKISDQELESIGIKIDSKEDKNKEKRRRILIPAESVEEYKKLIRKKLTSGYWNEFIGEEAHFIFKDKEGKISEYELNNQNLEEIAKKCAEYNKDPIEKTSNIWLYLASNDWYADYIIQEDEGVMINSDFLDGMDIHQATQKIMDYLEEKGWGKRTITYKMRDWLISRQRYWGAPIPIIHCDKCGAVPVPEKDLPVMLPEITDFKPSDDGRSPLSKVKGFVNVKCPKCGGKGQRETDTQDGFACSSWYFLRFVSPNYNQYPFEKKAMKYWMPVDVYVGGAEHAVMHLLYARFFTKVMYDEKIINFKEPFLKLKNQGMILAEDGRKMSKSLGNVTTPDETVKKYGADALRLFEMFIGPFEQEIAWSDNGIKGTKRFLEKYWGLVFEAQKKSRSKEKDRALETLQHKTIRKVGEDIENFKFNTAVSALMEFLNEVQKKKDGISNDQFEDCLKTITLLLAPAAPHISEEVWQKKYKSDNNQKWSVHQQDWPVYDSKLAQDEKITIVVQVNGRLRDTVQVEKGLGQKEVEKIAFDLEKIKKYTQGSKVKKTIFVENRILNIII